MTIALRSGWLITFATLALAAGCSSTTAGSTTTPTATDEDSSSAASELSSSQNFFTTGEGTPTADGTEPAANPAYPKCHPHLFARTTAYSNALNFHVDLFLHHIDDLLKIGPKTQSGSTITWEYDGPDAKVELILDKTAKGMFDVTVGVAAAGGTTFTNVVTGTIDRSNAEDVKKHFAFDFDGLHKVLPAGAADKSAGQLAIDVERVKDTGGTDKKRTVTYTLTGFVPVYGDPHGPRTGAIQFLHEPGVGGAMLYDASAVYFCPDNPTNLPADSNALARWYVKSGVVAGRADAIATGGQFPSGDHWVGISCRSGAAGSGVDNGYWLVKEEDASGATVKGLEVSVEDTVATDAACDPAFGAVTTLTNSTNDPTIPTAIPATAFPGQF